MTGKHVGAAVAVLAAATLSGCSPAAGNRAPVIELEQQDGFLPGGATIKAGDAVLWWNQDREAHRLALGDGRTITIQPGDVVETPFERSGTWVVRDSEAAEMLAVIEVVPA
jgi:plastocyanin